MITREQFEFFHSLTVGDWIFMISLTAFAGFIGAAILWLKQWFESLGYPNLSKKIGASFNVMDSEIAHEGFSDFDLIRHKGISRAKNVFRLSIKEGKSLFFDFPYGVGLSRTIFAFHLEGLNLPQFKLVPKDRFMHHFVKRGENSVRFQNGPSIPKQYLLFGSAIDELRSFFSQDRLAVLSKLKGWYLEGKGHWILVCFNVVRISLKNGGEFANSAVNVALHFTKLHDFILENKLANADRLIRQEKYEMALKVLSEVQANVLEKLSRDALCSYWHCMGTAYMRMQKLSEAIPYFENAFNLNAKRERTSYYMYLLGYCYAQTRQSAKSVDVLTRALLEESEKPLLIDILAQLSVAYRDSSEFGKAIATSRRIIQEFYPPSDETYEEKIHAAYLVLAECHWRLGEDEQADIFYEKLMEARNVKTWVLSALNGEKGNRYFSKGDFRKACDFYQKAIEFENKNPTSRVLKYWQECLSKAKTEAEDFP